MKKLISVSLLTVLLAGCTLGEESKVITSDKKPMQGVSVSQQKINYSVLANKQMTAFMKHLPEAFNERDLTPLKPYIRYGSPADRYLRNKLPSGYFDDYQIDYFSVDQIKADGLKRHVTTTRVMSSKATGNKWKKVVTVYELIYSPTKKTMLICDFNDKVVYPVNQVQEKAFRSVVAKYKAAATEEADGKVIFEKADPEIGEDASGTYYRFKALDHNGKLVHSYKYYQKTGQTVVE